MTAVNERSVPRVTFTFAVVALAVLAGTANAQAKGASKSALTWGPAPAAFPAGAKMAVEKGDPTKTGEFTVRLSFPAGYKIPPHWHPTAEHVRIVSGEFLVGMGDVLDAAKTNKLAVGDTGTVPPKGHHFAIAPVATEVSVRAQGPFAMTYVHAADDPRKKR
jgi:mannose-6-phosphate isomerase-like protein (cupin superfamily)